MLAGKEANVAGEGGGGEATKEGKKGESVGVEGGEVEKGYLGLGLGLGGGNGGSEGGRESRGTYGWWRILRRGEGETTMDSKDNKTKNDRSHDNVVGIVL